MMTDTDVIDHTNDTHYEPDQVTGEMKPVNETVRPDPQRFPTDAQGNEVENLVPGSGAIPEHEEGAIRGVIQHKEDPDGPIKEKLPDERDLAEGKITPAAVEKPQYDYGVTHEDVMSGKVAPAAVRESDKPFEEDEDLNDMITIARNRTQLARLNRAEVAEVFRVLEAEGYEVRKA